jgi:phosphatidylserine/phosphatidylglycerophosphate/cardiolipin synthase-like enzyme
VYHDRSPAPGREEAPEAAAQGRIQAFSLASCSELDGHVEYRPIYVHAKVAIVDDLWSTVGSANLNNRGMRDDTEINVATLNEELARGLRLLLWAEHLGLVDEESMLMVARHLGHAQRSPIEEQAEATIQCSETTLGDPFVGLHLMIERAQDNLRRFKARQPLVGHLMLYLTATEARQQGLPFHEDHGWIEVQGAT